MTNHIYTEKGYNSNRGSSEEFCTMGESLIQLYCNRLNNMLKPKNFIIYNENYKSESRLINVPAKAVIHLARALSKNSRRKEY